MRVLLLVEGQSDKKALPVLARKLVSPGTGFDALPVGKGDLLSAEKVSAHIRFAISRQEDIRKAVLCIDSECTDVEETRGRIDAVAAQVVERLHGLSIRSTVVDHSLEGWLLADRPAFAKHLGVQPGRLRYGDPELECRPAELMRKEFRRAGQDFIKTDHLLRLAEQADPVVIAKSSPTFRHFRQVLSDS